MFHGMGWEQLTIHDGYSIDHGEGHEPSADSLQSTWRTAKPYTKSQLIKPALRFPMIFSYHFPPKMPIFPCVSRVFPKTTVKPPADPAAPKARIATQRAVKFHGRQHDLAIRPNVLRRNQRFSWENGMVWLGKSSINHRKIMGNPRFIEDLTWF